MAQTATMLRNARSVRERVSAQEWEARVDLAAAHRLAELMGWTDLIYNHFTVRVPGEPGRFLLKQHGLMFEEVTASNLVKIGEDGKPVEEDADINPAAFTIHSAVYAARPEVNAVLHLHSAPGIALSASKRGLRWLSQDAMTFYDRISYHEFEGVALDLEERERIGRALGRNKAMILRNHGLLTCGDTVADAALRLRRLIDCAEVQLRIEAAGTEIVEPSPEVCERTAQQLEQLYRKDQGRPQWAAIRRWLDRKDPSYAD